jgi:hypothetical protein
MTDQGRSFERVRIDALVCGPGFQERMSAPRVIEIAERIASGRDVATPIVRASDMAVIAGEDVVAAFCVLDGAELEVELVRDGSFDDELPTELSPDSETRYGLGVAAAEAERTELTPVPVFETLSQSGKVVSVGVDHSGQLVALERVKAVQAKCATQRAAIIAVALETGKSEHAVKKAANRARRAKDKVDIQCWGRPQPEAWMAATAELRRTTTNASNAIRTAMSAVTTLMNGPPVPCVDLAGTYEELKARASKLRDARPACVCAWCKNEPALVVRCVACGGRGWLGELAMSRVPKELFPAGSAMAQGRAVELEPPKRDIFDELQEVEGGRPLYHGADSVPLEPAEVTVDDMRRELAERAAAGWPKAEDRAARYSEPEPSAPADDDGDVW